MENILKIAGITSIIAGSILAVGACLYWKAYNEMKKSPIIGWVAALLTMGCITTGITSLVYLFFQPIYFYLAIGAKIISESAIPQKSKLDPTTASADTPIIGTINIISLVETKVVFQSFVFITL